MTLPAHGAMESTFSPLVQLDAHKLARLAALHRSVMHGLLSDLGQTMVLRYYEIARAEPSMVGLCHMQASGEIDGWAMGSPTPGALNARLHLDKAWFGGQMIRLVFKHPAVLVELMGSLVSASDANQLRPGQIELTYIGVAQHAQRRGLGKALLDAFCQAANQVGYNSIALSVETDNPAAIGLYTHYGFRITRTFREGQFERHRMEYGPVDKA
jgi:ribosomal protein S18 acetylase RimI-like enzyme